jgi:hypothetical protein
LCGLPLPTWLFALWPAPGFIGVDRISQRRQLPRGD